METDDVLAEPPPPSNPTADTVVLPEPDVGLAPSGFDPYQQWLDIPSEHQPPNSYRLLDLPAFETDSYVISGAADRQVAKVNAVENDQQAHLKNRLIEEINRARKCLTNPEQKATYDRRLHKQFKKLKQAESTQQETEHQAAAQEVADAEDATAAAGEPDAEVAQLVEQAASQHAQPVVTEAADAPPRRAAHPPPKVVPPPVVRAPPVVTADVGVRALMHVDDEDEKGDDAFVSFADNRTEFESEMDMTPMVDVTFLLLIFFMVTASFSLQKSIEQPVQKQDEPSTNVTQQEFEDNPDYVVVQIDEFDTYRVIAADFDDEAPSEQELLMKLRRARDGRGGRVPTKLLVTAHGDASHGRVVMAMDAGTEVGMEQVQFTLAAEGDF